MFPTLIIGQNSDACCNFLSGTPWKGNNEFLYEYLKKYPQLDSGIVYFRVPISLHVFLNPKENIELLNRDIKKVIIFLNNIYSQNKTGIQFYLSDVKYYSIQRHLKTNYFLEAFFIGQKDRNKNSINLYYVNVLEKNVISKRKYYKGVYNSLSKSIILIRHSSKTTLAHEIGHYFGLMHPHRNWNKGKGKQEPVSRTRRGGLGNKILCQTRGDLLSDTPAEPELTHFTDKNCNYTGNLTDDWGDKYMPNTNNIMSYQANKNCRKYFTMQQKAVMLYTLNKYKASRYWLVNKQNKKFTFDKYEPDDAMSMANLLQIGTEQYHTFHFVISADKNLKFNNTDWFYSFSKSACGGQKIIISSGKNAFPVMKIYLLDSLGHIFLSKKITKPDEFCIGEYRGKYYIKLIAKAPEKEELLDYKIKIGAIGF